MIEVINAEIIAIKKLLQDEHLSDSDRFALYGAQQALRHVLEPDFLADGESDLLPDRSAADGAGRRETVMVNPPRTIRERAPNLTPEEKAKRNEIRSASADAAMRDHDERERHKYANMERLKAARLARSVDTNATDE